MIQLSTPERLFKQESGQVNYILFNKSSKKQIITIPKTYNDIYNNPKPEKTIWLE